MAVTATSSLLNMYGTEAPSFDAGPLTLGSASTMGGTFFNDTFGGPWSDNFSYPTFPALSAFSDSSEFSSSDLQPLDSSEEFFQQINGCSPMISTMHPNLVSTLKNMVAPGQISQAVEMYNSALLENLSVPSMSTHAHLEQDQSSIFLRHSQPSVVIPKMELQDLTSTVGAVLPTPDGEPPKVYINI